MRPKPSTSRTRNDGSCRLARTAYTCVGESSLVQEDTQPVQCPIDQTELMMTERNGVEIDYCPKCRGVWLDRGELDKVIDRASDAAPSRPVAQTTSITPTRNERDTPPGSYDSSRDGYRGDDDDYDPRTGKKKKKRDSFLEDLFDF
jgi:uncharacterized protein